ncbi:MAG: NupC/NupG family nucleoside CNT transporter [Armatimonadetes bacterium]|nr:NupC/NupG family nucleoside CNT transporter [Armatimonadota bacterium]
MVVALLEHSAEGARFVFGPLAKPDVLGKALGPENSVIFAFQSLVPTIIFFAALMAVLYQLGIMQRIVRVVAKLVVRVMETSGAETLSAVGNVFLGMVEAPLMIRPYLEKLTRSELFCVMVCGLSNVAGTVLAVYVGFLHDALPDIAGHLITMSVMSAPAGLLVAKLMIPEDGEPETRGTVELLDERPYHNMMDAFTGGATEGLRIGASVVAMLIAMVALVHFANSALGWPARVHNAHLLAQVETVPGAEQLAAGDAAAVQAALDGAGKPGRAWQPRTFQQAAGWLFRPLAWCLGVPRHDLVPVSQLLGERTVLNEFIAYLDMADMLKKDKDALTERGKILTSYALCAFANFGSVAIMIGGIAAMVPTRRRELAELGIPSLIGGTLAACLTACVVGVLI